ncbi:PREDICTED: uncharacterized protein LOC108767940 [Trachymyrmex cornetzi]|uniref:uncharacterized protein LOC108767940 n=1 Tax=Trachymyrmex cornetzi TaxID=471704 RepID=UPI00084EED4B|nr:PREDICTED: uncharacterized protein LOC108767940 [Trachymyrmex cornetzi]
MSYFGNFQDFVMSFTNYLSIQCLVQGNITKDHTINVIQSFITQIICRPLSNTKQFIRVASVVTNYYQVGVATIELSVLIELILIFKNEVNRNWSKIKAAMYIIYKCNFKKLIVHVEGIPKEIAINAEFRKKNMCSFSEYVIDRFPTQMDIL